MFYKNYINLVKLNTSSQQYILLQNLLNINVIKRIKTFKIFVILEKMVQDITLNMYTKYNID